MKCPECNAACWRDEADVGVGVIYGPWRCECCSWGEPSPYYDLEPDNDGANLK